MRGRVCLRICCWPLPAQSFLGLSPLGLATIFYCLRFETSLFATSYDSQGHGGGIRPRLHTEVGNISLSLMLRPTVSRPVCLGIKHPSGAYDQIYFRSEYGIRLTVTILILWGALSNERMGLSFVCGAGPCQRSLSRSYSLGNTGILVRSPLNPCFQINSHVHTGPSSGIYYHAPGGGGGCALTYRWVLDWRIGFIDTLYTTRHYR
jgi:hypothetical protein